MMTPRDRANIFTVPAGRPFLDCLAAAILGGDLPAAGGAPPRSPIALADVTLLLPTRRSTRALQEAFLRVSGGRAMLLPKIRPISEGEEDLSLLSGLVSENAAIAADIPVAMGELERRLTLTNLILRWAEAKRRGAAGADSDLETFAGTASSTPAQAAVQAGELAKLMDMVETEAVSFDGLDRLVPETLSMQWQQTLDFLKIITEAWPRHLAEKKLLSAVGRRNAIIRTEARRLADNPPKGPVIVAGVTGSIPATVELMRAVMQLPQGALVLPALDLHLDDASWDAIAPSADRAQGHPENPQYGLKTLLDKLGLSRADVKVLKGAEAGSAETARARFVSEAMRPAATTARWQAVAAEARKRKEAPQGLNLIEAPSAQDEAETVALILRHAADTPGRTAALVSPDRLLARRVAVRLESWGIKVDDSAGRPFIKTPPGAFLDLVVNAVAKTFAPAELMALLKHPLTRLGLDPFAARRAARALEIAAFRTAYLGEGLGGVEAALERALVETESGERRGRAVRRLWKEDIDGARSLIAALAEAMAPLTQLFARSAAVPLRDLARAHTQAAEAVARHPAGQIGDAEAVSPLWQQEAGEEGAKFFAGLMDDNLPALDIPPADYPDLYRSLIGTENIRPRGPVHPRLFIWGPFEARLQQPDIVILGSLNDGTWPQSADPGPWLNRPMRQTLGLPSPEEKIGQAAHDFATLLAAPQVYLTRAEKINGVPAVPSRWLLRLKALLDGMGARDALTPASPWLGWARQRDNVEPVARPSAPAPRPPVEKRPRRLSVSRIEAWLANPYAIFARDILKLEALDPLGQEPGPSLRGSIIHAALSRFAAEHPHGLPDDTKAELMRHAMDILDSYKAHPRIAAFWVPRFERFATWFAATEPERREGLLKVVTETSGALVLDAPAGPFKLTARADRIDIRGDALIVTDYKTGAFPSDARVLDGVSPQLPLEAAIALFGDGFENAKGTSVTSLRYISASGGEPPGKEHDIKVDDVAALAASARDNLARHVARFDNPATPYAALRRTRFFYDYDDYAHLARVAEWSQGISGAEEG